MHFDEICDYLQQLHWRYLNLVYQLRGINGVIIIGVHRWLGHEEIGVTFLGWNTLTENIQLLENHLGVCKFT